MEIAEIQLFNTKVQQLKNAFLDIQQPRSDFALTHFVMGEHATPERQYAQIVEEMRRAYSYIRTMLLDKERLTIEIERISKPGMFGKLDRLKEIEAEKKQIELDDNEATLLGKMREFNTLFRLWEAFDKKYTYKEIDQAEPAYWAQRLANQAAQDRLANMNGVRTGIIDAIRQAGFIPAVMMDLTAMANQLSVQVQPSELPPSTIVP